MSLLAEVRGFPRVLASARLTARVTATGEWDVDKLARLLEGVHGLRTAAVVADVDAAELGAPDTPDRALRDYLETGLPPLWSSRWAGRCSVVLGGTLTGSSGAVVSVVDSVPPLGDNLVHLQPLDWLAAGLRGEATSPGAVLLDVEAEDVGAATRAVAAAGLRGGTQGDR